jgi:hypothetical protein
MRTLLCTLCTATILLPMAASAKLPQDVQQRMDRGRPTARFVRYSGRNPVTALRQKNTIVNTPLDAEYRNQALGVQVNYPSSWEIQDTPQDEHPLTLVVAFLSPSQGGVRQNVNLVIEELEKEMTLSEYTAQGLDVEKKILGDFQLIDTQNISYLGMERATLVRFSAVSDGRPMHFEQIWFLRGRKVYVWTYADKKESFRSGLQIFERMMDSFTVQR